MTVPVRDHQTISERAATAPAVTPATIPGRALLAGVLALLLALVLAPAAPATAHDATADTETTADTDATRTTADTGTTAEPTASGITPAPAHLPQTPTVDTTPQVLDLTFPVADPDTATTFFDDFLYLRGGGSRLHAATDVMAPKHRPVHAAMGGHITWAPYPEPGYGWMVSILGDDGHRYAYVHLNNDTPQKDANGTWMDDDQGGVEHAYAPRIVEAIRDEGTARGLRIERGELIGWNGDGGNAKGIAPHLHFEIHVPPGDGHDGYRINPFHSLEDALERGDVPSPVAASFDGPFRDVGPAATHADAIGRLADEGIVTACDGDRYCPGDVVTRGDLAVSIAAVAGLATTATTASRFPDVATDDDRAGAIAAVDGAGILTGYEDGTFGPEDALTRAQLASMLVRTFDIPSVDEDPPFTDVVPGRTHVAEIAATYAAGLTVGCEDGARYCGRDDVNRAQVATFLDRGRTAFGTAD